MHIPRGQRLPDMNSIVYLHLSATVLRVYTIPLLTAAVSLINRLPCETKPGPRDAIERPSRSDQFRGPARRP